MQARQTFPLLITVHKCSVMYLSIKSPSSGNRHIETSWLGAFCALLLHAGKH